MQTDWLKHTGRMNTWHCAFHPTSRRFKCIIPKCFLWTLFAFVHPDLNVFHHFCFQVGALCLTSDYSRWLYKGEASFLHQVVLHHPPFTCMWILHTKNTPVLHYFPISLIKGFISCIFWRLWFCIPVKGLAVGFNPLCIPLVKPTNSLAVSACK